jgi:bifunctional non-homologous end joining protein LigD
MPLDWAKVREGLDPGAFTVRSAPRLLRRSRPWKEYPKSAQPFRQARERLLETE